MNLVSILIGVIGLVVGLLSYLSTKSLKSKLLTEKELIRDKILDIRQLWIGYRDKVLNDRIIQNNDTLNTLNMKLRIEDIEGYIENLDRFAERLEKLS